MRRIKRALSITKAPKIEESIAEHLEDDVIQNGEINGDDLRINNNSDTDGESIDSYALKPKIDLEYTQSLRSVQYAHCWEFLEVFNSNTEVLFNRFSPEHGSIVQPLRFHQVFYLKRSQRKYLVGDASSRALQSIVGVSYQECSCQEF